MSQPHLKTSFQVHRDNDPSLTVTDIPGVNEPLITQRTKTPTQKTLPHSPTETEAIFEISNEITIECLQELEINGSEITFEKDLADRSNYHQHLVSYISEGHKIYGLLTIPFVEPLEGRIMAFVFNHGYILPPLTASLDLLHK